MGLSVSAFIHLLPSRRAEFQMVGEHYIPPAREDT